MRRWLLVVGICFVAIPGFAAEERIHALLRSMADGGAVPSEKAFYAAVDEDYINQLSADTVAEFLPLARTLLQDPRPEARRYALQCFLSVTLRRSLDSEVLLERYVRDLLEIADDHASPLRNVAVFVLGNTQPRVSPTTLAYLAAHLIDVGNTAGESGSMSCTLLQARSDPLTRDVIAFVRKQNKHETVIAVLQCLRIYPTTNADALAFIGSSLESPDVLVRRRAVEAVGALPVGERSHFRPQLDRLSRELNEPAEVRAAADEVLKK